MKQLPKKWSDYLYKQPETGMGYQTVNLILRGGRRVENVAIIESHIIGEVRGSADLSFDPEDIVDIEITH